MTANNSIFSLFFQIHKIRLLELIEATLLQSAGMEEDYIYKDLIIEMFSNLLHISFTTLLQMTVK